MSVTLEESYRHCEAVARARAKNFYYSFLLLPAVKRRSMCAVYAFMRRCDDLSDGAEASAEGLARWREELRATLAGRPGPHALWPALQASVERHGIPGEYLHAMIDGVSRDFEQKQVETFEELYRYCYLVASIVGMTIVHIFGFNDQRALALAEKCGIAFQLTNILRDVKEDHAQGRVYLPREDLRRFGVSSVAEDSAELRALLRFEGDRARGYYEEARPLIAMVEPDSRAALWALIEIYRRLLGRMEAADYDVLRRRVALPTAEKLFILGRAWLGGGR